MTAVSTLIGRGVSARPSLRQFQPALRPISRAYVGISSHVRTFAQTSGVIEVVVERVVEVETIVYKPTFDGPAKSRIAGEVARRTAFALLNS